MKGLSILCLVFLLVVSLFYSVGCEETYTQEDLDVVYEAGHAEGYDAGSHAGYKVGYGEGYDIGFNKGYDTGYEDGYNDGLGHAAEQESKDELKVHFIDVGQGDSILVDLGGTEILIDGGGKSPGVVEYLSDYVDGAIEAMVATHPHADHIGGLIEVLDIFQVEEIWLNGDTSTSETYSQFISSVNSEGAQVYEVRRWDTFQVGDIVFNVLHPDNLSGTTNNNSIVLSLSYGQVYFLFMGDAEQEAESSMLNVGIVPDAEMLKVGHHGSSSSSSAQFLDIVRPLLAIYMSGEGNSYGHPHQETITALAEVNAEVYGTDIHGTIIISTGGEGYTKQLEKPAAPRAPPVVSTTPAAFSVTNLSISPSKAEVGETVTISFDVTNSGGSSGSYAAILRINGSEVETKSVVLNAGESQEVSFTVIKESIGTYTVEVGGLADTFTVKEATTSSETDFVYITRTGAKYHRAGCRYLSQSCIRIERAEAIRNGYTPCSVCRP